MSSIGKMKMFLTLGLTLILIVQVVMFLLLKPEASYALPFFYIIVGLALLALLMNYLNLKKVEKRVKALPKDYKNFYVNANEVIAMSTMHRSQKKFTIDMILEILEHAHQDGRKLEDLVKNNPKGFIEGFVNASGGKLSYLYLLGYSTMIFVLYLFLLKGYNVFRNGDGRLADLATQPLDLGIVITYVLIAFVFFPWLLISLQKAAANQSTGLSRLKILLPLTLPIGLMAGLIVIRAPWLRTFLDQPMPIMNNVWLILFWFVVGLGGYALTRYVKRKQIRKSLMDD